MSHTDTTWTQSQANTDLEIFVGACEFKDSAGLATFAAAAGLLSLNLAATQAGTFFADVTAFLRRTGMLATPTNAQNQFGTAAAQPGPSSVAGTSGPLALSGGGFPPLTGANLPTVKGPVTGATSKGLQLNSIDVIYSNTVANLGVATIGVQKTKFADTTAPVVADILALAANGLPVAFQATPHVKNVAIASPAMLTDTQSEVTVNVNLTAGAGSTVKFYGVNLHLSYNFN